ncbi:MAG: hypothetical protein HY231_21965 [Acidobacteria bacterium]|nr:hypothetical protein [Acidobacteriota bacterium]
MSLGIENEIPTSIEQAVQTERERIFKLICPYCAIGNAPERIKERSVFEFAWWHWPEDREDRRHCEAARLREWMQLPNHASQLLAAQISRISERVFHQPWMNDIEFNLWTVLKDMHPVKLPGIKRYFGFENISDEELVELRKLAEQADGWVYWDIYDRAFKFVSFSDWENVFATQLDRYRSIPREFEKIIKSVPQEELEQLPSDSSQHHDQYIHGASKKE